ncbi:MOSC domain-containing protein [Aeromicrobium sp. P5_D10]
MAILESINVGPTVDVPWGKLKRSAIDKRPVSGAVQVHRLGVGDDEIGDQKFHGGPDQAVYAYAREDLDLWEREIGRALRSGEFGENLTTRGLDVQNARLGDRWQIGSVVLEVTGVRIPCSVFQGFVDEHSWVKRFTQMGIPGAYLRVIEQGQIQAGDAIEVVERRAHDLTIGFAFRALTTRRDLLRQLGTEERVSASIRTKVDEFCNDPAM